MAVAVSLLLLLGCTGTEEQHVSETEDSTAQRAGASDRFPAISFHIASLDPDSDAVEKPLPGGEGIVYVEQEPVLTARDIARASVDDRRSDPSAERASAIQVVFTEEGIQKLYHATRSHVEERLAMIAHEKIVHAPVIRAAIEAKEMVVTELSAREAEQIASELNRR